MKLRQIAVIVAVGSLLAACGGGSPSAGGGGGGDISADLEEWQISLSSSTGSAGEITFNVTNNGEEEHEFVIVATDLDAGALPVVDDLVDESAFTPVDEIEDIEAGDTPSLTVDLEPGHYVILCNLTAHYGKGMHANFTVE